MHVEFLVEEASSEAALRSLLPRILETGITWAVHPFRSKDDLLRQLPSRLRAYAAWIPKNWRIVVLVDRDRDDCLELKQRLERLALDAGLTTRGSQGAEGDFTAINRIAIEELESWFFGDIPALCGAYPKVSPSLSRKKGYREPDAIAGGTWEALERELQRAGYHRQGLPKITVARAIAKHMDPACNTSKSFQAFRDALMSLSDTKAVVLSPGS